MNKPNLKVVAEDGKSTFDLDRFKSSRPPGSAGVAALVTALPVHKISEARDFVRIQSEEDMWTPELCFVNVPVKGQRTSHAASYRRRDRADLHPQRGHPAIQVGTGDEAI